MKKNRLFLYGTGGHAKVIADMAEGIGLYLVGGIDQFAKGTLLLDQYPIHFGLDSIEQEKNDLFIVAIGNNEIRKRIVEGELRDCNFTMIKDKSALVSRYAKIGEGTVIMPGATVNVCVNIGRHCIINTNASIDHDCVIEDYVHISPNASLAGNVAIGSGTHIGIGAIVIQGLRIGKCCTIGAGTVIIRDVPDGVTVVGNPGRIIKQKNK